MTMVVFGRMDISIKKQLQQLVGIDNLVNIVPVTEVSVDDAARDVARRIRPGRKFIRGVF